MLSTSWTSRGKLLSKAAFCLTVLLDLPHPTPSPYILSFVELHAAPIVKPSLLGRSLQAAVLLNFPSTTARLNSTVRVGMFSRFCRAVAVLSNACSRLRIFANTSCAAHVTALACARFCALPNQCSPKRDTLLLHMNELQRRHKAIACLVWSVSDFEFELLDLDVFNGSDVAALALRSRPPS